MPSGGCSSARARSWSARTPTRALAIVALEDEAEAQAAVARLQGARRAGQRGRPARPVRLHAARDRRPRPGARRDRHRRRVGGAGGGAAPAAGGAAAGDAGRAGAGAVRGARPQLRDALSRRGRAAARDRRRRWRRAARSIRFGGVRNRRGMAGVDRHAGCGAGADRAAVGRSRRPDLAPGALAGERGPRLARRRRAVAILDRARADAARLPLGHDAPDGLVVEAGDVGDRPYRASVLLHAQEHESAKGLTQPERSSRPGRSRRGSAQRRETGAGSLPIAASTICRRAPA